MADEKVRNMEQFAALSGISRPTVSKYFNDPASVRDSTRQRIEAALAQYEYRPNIYAVNQNRQLTKNIGIMVPFLADPFFAEIARKIETLCIEAGFRPILLSAHGAPEQEVENLENLLSLRPAGVLLAPLGRASDRGAIEKFCAQVPTVLFDSNVDGVGDAFVGMDNPQSIDIMIKYLTDTGEPPVFFEMQTPPNPNANKRRHAYLRAMEQLGYEPQIIHVPGAGWEFEDIGFREGMRVLSEHRLMTNTILCSNDRLAIGLLAAAYESGLRVGRGTGSALRIAGHDDHPFSRFTCPSLTTVAQDYDSIASKGVETLMSLIESGSRPANREDWLFAGRLITRNSA
ncbi:LacI family DNA-binding transcriptional regulator [Gymnodinialimonas sp. 2305UL16-5]|uniref:LacI family DNA-binding transcriptional regulator n=1 Tax=Gymnodinialimonas mytili TaxID=3126503 RepID=UPI0030B68CD6